VTRTPIGAYRTGRLTCGAEHLPGCYNPGLYVTACRCGAAWWVGRVGVWISSPAHAPDAPAPSLGIGIGAPGLRLPTPEFYGWDTYYLHADACAERDEPCSPCCGGSTPTDYHAAATAARVATGRAW
jgi:hypothetical protein